MSQDVASKQPLISTALEVKPAAEDQNQQRKCGVHRLQVFSHTRFLFKDSKRVMPKKVHDLPTCYYIKIILLLGDYFGKRTA